MDYFSDYDYKAMEVIVQNYGASGTVRLLVNILSSQANELSDLGLKGNAAESALMSEKLSELLLRQTIDSFLKSELIPPLDAERFGTK
jgi:hypothetical protein